METILKLKGKLKEMVIFRHQITYFLTLVTMKTIFPFRWEKTKFLVNGKQILVGSSMGGWIALLLAKNRPHRIHSIIGVAAAPDFTEDLMWSNFNDNEKKRIIEDGILLQESEYSDEPYKISRNLILDSKNCLVLREKLNFEFPIRLLQGTADSDVPLDLALRLINHIDCNDAKLEIVKGADHSFSSEKCLKLIVNNLEELLELE